MNAAPWIDAPQPFRGLGVPHRRIEEWKYTDLKTALDGANDAGASGKRVDRYGSGRRRTVRSRESGERARLGKSALRQG